MLGGWEETFKERLNENTFCDIELWDKERRLPEANLYVTDRREFSAIRNESILALKEFMDRRLQIDKNVNVSKSFTAFTKFAANENEIRDIYHSIAPDLSLADLAVEFQELQQRDALPKSKPHTVLQNIVKADNEHYYQNVSVGLGRILVCKPHSVDCERVISLHNKMKSTCSSSLKRQTMSDTVPLHKYECATSM